MPKKTKWFGVVGAHVGAAFLFCAAVAAQGQESDATAVERGVALFESGEWEAANHAFARLLADPRGLEEGESRRAHRYLSLGQILLGEEEAAVLTLKRLLRRAPGFGLDDLAFDGMPPTNDLKQVFARAQAATDPAAALALALALNGDGEWEYSSLVLDEILQEPGRLALASRSRARKYLGINRILLKRDDAAVEVFKDLVREDSQFGMDDLAIDGHTPAQVVQLFGQAILEVRREELAQRQAQLSQTSRGSAFVRSVLMPGWGQRYQGYRARSFVMLGLTLASAAYVGSTDAAFRQARRDYQKAGAGEDFAQLFQEYTDRADNADRALGILAAVWAYNMIDALIQGPNTAGLGRNAGVSLEPGPDGGLWLALSARF